MFHMFDSDSCRTWAKEASDAYLADSTPLGDTIAGIAKKNSLNPNQIQRVVELTNSITHARLFQKEKDKTFTFPLAKLDDILAKTKETTVKVAEAYVSMPDIQRPVESTKIAELFDSPEVLDINKIATLKKAQIYIEKMEKAAECLNDALILADLNAVQYLKDAKTVIKQMLLDSYHMEDLFAAMIGAMPDKKMELLSLFSSICKELSEEGVKIASLSVDPNYISSLLKTQNIRVVNGQHPLYMNVKGYFDQVDEVAAKKNSIEWLGSKINELKHAIK